MRRNCGANDIAANHEAYAYTMYYDFLESGGIPIPLFFIMSITRAAVHEKPLPPSPSPVKGL